MQQTSERLAVNASAVQALPEQPSERHGGHARVIALIGGTTATMLLAGMARLKLIAVFLGPAGMGIAGAIEPAAQMAVQLGALNIPTAALRFLPIAKEQQGNRGFAWLYRTLFRIVLVVPAVAALLTLVVFFILARLGHAGSIADYPLSLTLCLAAVPLTASTNYIRNALSTLHRYRAAGLTIGASSIILVAGTYQGLHYGGLAGAYLAALVAGGITVVALHLQVARAISDAPAASSGSLPALLRAHPGMVSFSMTMYAVGFAVPLSYWVVRWTVFGTLGEDETGFLTAALAVAAGLRAVFAQSGSQYLIPLASRSVDRGALAAESARYLRTLMLLLLAAGLPFLLFPRAVILALYSRAFLPVVGVIGLFIVAEMIMALADNYRVMLIGLNDLRGCLAMTYTTTAVVIAGTFLVVPQFGLPGLAVLHVVAALLTLAWSFDRLRSRHAIRLERRTLMMGAYVLASLGLAVEFGRLVPTESAAVLGAKVALAAAFILGGITVLPTMERRGVVALVSRRFGGYA